MLLSDYLSATNDRTDSALCPAFIAEVDRVVEEFDLTCRAAFRAGQPLPSPESFIHEASPQVQDSLRRALPRVADEVRKDLGLASVPGYEVIREIGRGGMGVVYQARQLATGRVVALKRLEGGEEERAIRLNALLNLKHPNVVELEGLVQQDGRLYLVMEYVESGNLKDRMAEFSLASCQVASQTDIAQRKLKIAGLMRQIAEGVAALHSHLVLHRDIKPSNILPGEDGRARVCDMGLMRRLDFSGTLTHSQAIVGTLPYMAPEQAVVGADRAPLSVRADIYALGAVLYELLTGHAPFPESHNDPLTLLNRKVNETPSPPGDLNPLIRDSDLAWICMKCLQLNPADRFASAEEFARVLSAYERGERVRDDESFWHMLRRLLNPLRRLPADPEYIEHSKLALRVEACTSLASHIGLFLLAWYAAPGPYVWACFMIGTLLVGWMIWLPPMRSRRHSPMSQQVAQLWLGADVASAFLFMALVPLVGNVTPEVLARFYAGYSVIRGLTFFIEGRSCWGPLYLTSLAFFASALIMPCVPALAPLIHGVMYSGWFLWLSCQEWQAKRSAVI